jgi:diacylglycerol kinase
MSGFIRSFGYAIRGIAAVVREQRNIKILFGIALLVGIAGFYFEVTRSEWCILLLCVGVVTGGEMFNSSIENLVDLVTRERLPLAGKIKDIAAGAVLLLSIISFIIGVIIFLPYIVAYL